MQFVEILINLILRLFAWLFEDVIDAIYGWFCTRFPILFWILFVCVAVALYLHYK